MGLLAAALATALASSAHAGKWACTGSDERGRIPRLPEVLACQKSIRERYIEAVRKKKRRDPTFEEIDRFDDFQRAEVRAYSERHPREATVEGERESERAAEAGEPDKSFLQRLAESFGLGPEKVVEPVKGKATVDAPPAVREEGRKALGLLKDGSRMGEVDLEAAAAKARQDPQGTLKRAVTERNRQFEANVPEEAKRFYKKPGAAPQAAPDGEELQ